MVGGGGFKKYLKNENTFFPLNCNKHFDNKTVYGRSYAILIFHGHSYFKAISKNK